MYLFISNTYKYNHLVLSSIFKEKHLLLTNIINKFVLNNGKSFI